MVTQLLVCDIVNTPKGPDIGPKIVLWELKKNGAVRETVYDAKRAAQIRPRVALMGDEGMRYFTPERDGAVFLEVAAALFDRATSLATFPERDDRPPAVPVGW